MKEHPGDLFDRIKTSKNLPSLPHILLKLIETCEREDSTIQEISQIINKDSSLTAKILKLVNSSYYGLSKRVNSIEQALVLLGIDAVKNISISASINQAFRQVKMNDLFDLKIFWRHSLTCAVLAKLIAKKVSYPTPEEAFLSGLLHDIGKLVLWVNFPKEYGSILKSSKEQSDLILAGEAQHGATHCEVGAWLINRWHLQSFMTDAVLYHHESVDRIHHAFPLVKIIYAANILCPEINKEESVKLGITENLIGLKEPEVEEFMLQTEEEVSVIASSMDIDIEPPHVPDKGFSRKDYEKQKDLTSEIKDFALLQGTLLNLLETTGEDAILKVLHQGLQILFDARPVIFFKYDPERNTLAGKSVAPNQHHHMINEMVIPFQEGKSLLVNTLLQGEPLHSFNDTKNAGLTIIDEQIIRVIGKDGFFCLPMIAYKQYVGVIVMGMEEVRISHLSAQAKRLKMFTKQAALALHTHDLRQRQARLVMSERLTASSTLARKVFHEVNTPLSIIKNYLSVLKRKLVEGYPVQEELRVVNEEIDRVAHILRDLSDFSEPKIHRDDLIDINALLADIIKVFQESHLLRANIDAKMALAPSLPTVHSDKNSLKQVFINLIQNAVESMPRGGNLYIGTRYISKDSLRKAKPDAAGEEGSVEISVRDDGPGIPDELKSRLFEPFITSKGAGHAGLGLSIVYNTVKELKGTITYRSDGENGTCFKVVLPIKS